MSYHLEKFILLNFIIKLLINLIKIHRASS